MSTASRSYAPSTSAAGAPSWLGAVVVVAAILTPLVAATVGWFAQELEVTSNPVAVLVGPAIILQLLFLTVAPPSRVPRVVRAAIVTTMAQLVLALAAWAIWNSNSNVWANLIDLPLEATVSAAVAMSALLFTVALASQSMRRRRAAPRWLRPVVVFAIANLFLLGLWLPLFASMWPVASLVDWGSTVGKSPAALFFAAGLPALIALWLACTRPSAIARCSVGLLVALATAVLAGVAVRGDSGPIAQQTYGQYAPLLIASALFALGAIATLAVAQLRELSFHRRDAREPDPWVQRGTAISITDDAPGTWLGGVRFTGWLSGFSSEVAAFRVRTKTGTIIEVPRGSMLSLPLPSQSCQASAGEIVVSLRVGDPVAVAGYVSSTEDSAFRKNPAPIPSASGVIVYGPGQHRPLASMALLLWRPCVLYLIATSSIALPGLVGLPL